MSDSECVQERTLADVKRHGLDDPVERCCAANRSRRMGAHFPLFLTVQTLDFCQLHRNRELAVRISDVVNYKSLIELGDSVCDLAN